MGYRQSTLVSEQLATRKHGKWWVDTRKHNKLGGQGGSLTNRAQRAELCTSSPLFPVLPARPVSLSPPLAGCWIHRGQRPFNKPPQLCLSQRDAFRGCAVIFGWLTVRGPLPPRAPAGMDIKARGPMRPCLR